MLVPVLSHFSRVQLFVSPPGSSWENPPWDSPGKNTAVGCCALLQGIFLTQGSNQCLLLVSGFFSVEPLGSPSITIKVKVPQLCWTLWIPQTIQSMKFSRPEYGSEEPFPSPGDLPNPGVKSRSPLLQVDSLPAEPQGKSKY